jgi:hypothetical protein
MRGKNYKEKREKRKVQWEKVSELKMKVVSVDNDDPSIYVRRWLMVMVDDDIVGHNLHANQHLCHIQSGSKWG